MHLQATAKLYAAAGHPEWQSWLFQRGQLSEAHRELETAGLIERVFGERNSSLEAGPPGNGVPESVSYLGMRAMSPSSS